MKDYVFAVFFGCCHFLLSHSATVFYDVKEVVDERRVAHDRCTGVIGDSYLYSSTFKSGYVNLSLYLFAQYSVQFFVISNKLFNGSKVMLVVVDKLSYA